MPLRIDSGKELIARINNLLTSKDGRVIIGIAGKPGAGKSTLVEFLARNYSGDDCEVVPMDGFLWVGRCEATT